MFGSINWHEIFTPDASVFEMIVRGSVMYIVLFTMLRVILKRQSGTLGITDLLLVTLLADASQNAMAGQYNSISDGVVLVATIIFWNFAFDWLSYHFPRFRRFIDPSPLCLVRDGRMLRKNLRRELVTEEELMGQLRQQGIEELSKVKAAYMESDGRISVIQQEEERHGKRERQQT